MVAPKDKHQLTALQTESEKPNEGRVEYSNIHCILDMKKGESHVIDYKIYIDDVNTISKIPFWAPATF